MDETHPQPETKLAYEAPDVERPASATPPATEPAHDPYAALRHPGYLIFSAGWMISVIGNLMTIAALQWEIFDNTKSKLNLGWIGGIQAIPLVLLALPAGALADTFDRRRIISLCTAMSAVTSLGFAYMSYKTGPHYLLIMFALLLVQSTFLVLSRPARSSLLPLIVPTRVFANAVTWNASFFQMAAMAGPALAGLVIATCHDRFGNISLAYVIDSVCSFVFAGSIMFLKSRPIERDPNGDTSVFGRLTAGIRFVGSNPVILATMTLDLFAVLLGGAVYLLPVFATELLHAGAVGFGWLRASEAIGAFCMALLIAHLPPMKHAGRAMLLAVAGFGCATIVFGLSRNYWLSLAMVFVIGAFDNISVVVRHTLVQILTPDSMRGRVSAVNNIFIGASNELGGLESGLTAAMFGPVKSVVSGGIGTIVVVILAAMKWPALRKFGALKAPEKL